MGISNISRSFLLYQLHTTMQLRLKAESHHWWLWNELLFLVHLKIPISSSQTRDEILKERRIKSAGRRNFSCYPMVKSLNEEILRIGDCVPATSSVFVSVDKGRIPSSCYPLPQLKNMKGRAKVSECLTDDPMNPASHLSSKPQAALEIMFFLWKIKPSSS